MTHFLTLLLALTLSGQVEADATPSEEPAAATPSAEAAVEESAQEADEDSAQSRPRIFRGLLHEHPTILHMLQQNNALRRMVGLGPHRLNPRLVQAAQDHANYMARTGEFSHYGRNADPNTRARRYGYRGMVRENIAMGYRGVEAAFQGWRSSGGHWASIVSGTYDAGFGYAVSAGGTPYWVGLYGYATEEDRKETIDPNAAPPTEENAEGSVTLATAEEPAENDAEPAADDNSPTPPPLPGSEVEPSSSNPAGGYYNQRSYRRGLFRRR